MEDENPKETRRGPIPPVSVERLRRDAEAGNWDPGVETLRKAELDYIRKKRPTTTEHGDDLAGLALSGGGIRSATFALGVMQALAARGVLQRMDYLSSVSGGGYIGSALAWFLGPQNGTPPFGLDRENFPWGIDAGGESKPDQRRMLDWLRQHGNYLTPGKADKAPEGAGASREAAQGREGDAPPTGKGKITFTSLLAVVLRGVVLNLIVWLPILVLVFLGLLWVACGAVGVVKGWPLPPAVSPWLPALQDAQAASASLVLLGASVAAIALATFALAAVAYSLLTLLDRLGTDSWYRHRRWVETWSRWLLWILAGGLIAASFPLVQVLFGEWVANAGGPVAALIGAVSGLLGFQRTMGSAKGPMSGLAGMLAAALLIYGIALVCYRVAAHLYGIAVTEGHVDWSWGEPWSYYALALAVAVGTGLAVNTNYVSVHRFYRDRLMEAFLPDRDAARAGRTGPAVAANTAMLKDVVSAHGTCAPYPIINAHVILVNSRDRRRRLRGGDNFILTPNYCGSCATGWVSTEKFFDGQLTLATAMAISGAAANPNTGSGGVGMTRSRSVSLLMTLLNLRLGYWTPNPRQGGERRLPPNHFYPGLLQALGRHHEHWPFIELSDGGHFDNLALYELIRRRLRLIIVCDGAADPRFSFADLNTLRRRIAADFEARITFDLGEGQPEDLIPNRLRGRGAGSAGYATGADMAERAFIVGQIEYAGPPDRGVLIYLKTTMIENLSFGVKAYKGAHPDFPDETTADQFFDEEQFDAYRELGNHLASTMLDETGLADSVELVAQKGQWMALKAQEPA